LALLAANSPVPGVQVQIVGITGDTGNTPPLALQANSPAVSQAQRWTVSFNIVFTDPAQAFALLTAAGNNNKPVTLALAATFSSNLDWSTSIPIQLVANADPFMVAGSTFYLSRDLRVFQVIADGTANNSFGVPFVAGEDPCTWFAQILTDLKTANSTAQQAISAIFDSYPDQIMDPTLQAQAEASFSTVSFSPTLNGKNVYYFAIARVTLQGLPNSAAASATNVQVLFRLFPAPSLGTAYSTSLYPTEPATALTPTGLVSGLQYPIPAQNGNEFLSIPFFAAHRSQVKAANPDPSNLWLTITPAASGDAVYTYFGCYLDINDPSALIGTPPAPLSAYAMNSHQCLVAQIVFPGLTIPGNSVPGVDTDKLAQRNLTVGTGTP
jgi:hypothetical protein